MPPLPLSDTQLHRLLAAASPLDPGKRVVLMERLAGSLRRVRNPGDRDLDRAIRQALHGLLQGHPDAA